MVDTSTRVAELRDLMRKNKLHALIVPTNDAHMSEYTATHDHRREFITGFSGSAGTAVITLDDARLWTDGRYFLQALQQLSAGWTLMRDRLPDTPSIESWVAVNMEKGGRVGLDPFLCPLEFSRRLEKTLVERGHAADAVVYTEFNLVDRVWGAAQPPAPHGAVMVLEDKYTGRTSADKVQMVREDLTKNKVDAVVISALDEVAWLLNIRGSDVAYNPVVISYVIVTQESVVLYVDETKLDDAVRAHLGGVTIKPYASTFPDLTALGKAGATVWLPPATANRALFNALPADKVKELDSPITNPKSVKNAVEVEGMRNAHLRDGAALIQWIAWLEDAVAKGVALTEITASDRLEEFRAAQKDFVSLSFPTIPGMGPNGAIIHYHAEPGSAASITRGMFLVDSGGQYKDGTTDVTRTLHLGEPTDREKRCYTRVLQGHIALDSVVFPRGVGGRRLDTLARMHLWADGLDYRHGTGHGVGHFLNVHEGPHGISPILRADDPPIYPGMIVTNEPGYYEDGAFGIRIENVLVCKDAPTPNNFAGTGFYMFESLTLVPMERKLMDVALMTDSDIAWVNAYHAKVLEKVGPLLPPPALAWLQNATASIAR